MRNIAVVIIAAFLFTFAPSPRPVYACAFVPCPNQGTAATQYTSLANQAFEKIQTYAIRIAEVQQALQYAIEFYNYMKSLEYMSFNGNFMNDISQVTSVASGLTGMYAQGESMIGQIGLQNGMSQQTANEWFQSASDTSQLAASGAMLSGAAQQLGMLGTLNGGSGFLTAANGASMVTSAALLGAQSIISYADYQRSKQLALMQNALLQREKLKSQYGWATLSGHTWIPCRDISTGLNELMYVPVGSAATCATAKFPTKGIPPPTPLEWQLAMARWQAAKAKAMANHQPIPPMPQQPQPVPGTPATVTPPPVFSSPMTSSSTMP